MNINKKFLDKELYAKVRDEIIKAYPKHSAYRSMMIVKEYKNRGGRIAESRNKNKEGTSRWLDEQWINMDAYLDGAIVKCGAKGYEDKSACRPLIRVSKFTPMTASEVVNTYGKKAVQKAINKKNSDPQNLILKWEDRLKVIKKNKK